MALVQAPVIVLRLDAEALRGLVPAHNLLGQLAGGLELGTFVAGGVSG